MRDSFPSFVVSQIIENKPRNFLQIQDILATMGLMAEKRDCEVIYMVCDTVSRRAAYMCAAGIAAIALKIADNRYNYRINTLQLQVFPKKVSNFV